MLYQHRTYRYIQYSFNCFVAGFAVRLKKMRRWNVSHIFLVNTESSAKAQKIETPFSVTVDRQLRTQIKMSSYFGYQAGAPQAKTKYCFQITYMLISPDTITTNSIKDIWAAKNKRILFKILSYDLSSLKTRYD